MSLHLGQGRGGSSGFRGYYLGQPTSSPGLLTADLPSLCCISGSWSGVDKPEAQGETYRGTFGGTLASRELWFGRSGSDRDLSLHCGLVTRVSGRTPFGAYCPKRSLAREASTLSLATCPPGFPGVVLIPLGRLSTSPIPLLARVALWFHHPHRRAGYVHTRRLRESIKAVAIAGQPCGYAQRSGNNSSGIQERCRGPGGGLHFIAYSHGKSSWGGHSKNTYYPGKEVSHAAAY